MSSTTLISLDEYMRTVYEPDMEFVDGVLVRRNVGTQRHGLLQAILASHFGGFRHSHRIPVFTETRLLLDATVPDGWRTPSPYRP